MNSQAYCEHGENDGDRPAWQGDQSQNLHRGALKGENNTQLITNNLITLVFSFTKELSHTYVVLIVAKFLFC